METDTKKSKKAKKHYRRIGLFEIRPAKNKDRDAVLKIRNEPDVVLGCSNQFPISKQAHDSFWKQNWTAKNDGRTRIYVVDTASGICGFGRIDLNTKLSVTSEDGLTYIETIDGSFRDAVLSLALRRWARGKGLGSEILKFLVEEAKDAGAKIIRANIRSSNINSMGLFLNHGFTPINEVIEWRLRPIKDEIQS